VSKNGLGTTALYQRLLTGDPWSIIHEGQKVWSQFLSFYGFSSLRGVHFKVYWNLEFQWSTKQRNWGPLLYVWWQKYNCVSASTLSAIKTISMSFSEICVQFLVVKVKTSERERQIECVCICVFAYDCVCKKKSVQYIVYMCVCVCVRDREKDRETKIRLWFELKCSSSKYKVRTSEFTSLHLLFLC